MAEQNPDGTQQKRRVRSPYLFPAYAIATALQVAEIVENDGGGSLNEATLAMAMSSSAKSSTFRLKTLTGKQFGVIAKSGENLQTTPLGKAILKPTHDAEKAAALAEAFLNIPLFREVTQRYKGQPLPNSGSLRNILERELGITNKRVPNAERVLMDSARDAGVLRTAGSNTYLAPETDASAGNIEVNPPNTPETIIDSEGHTVPPSVGGIVEPPNRPGQFSLSEEDLALLEDDEFDHLWSALGKIARRRGKRQLTQHGED